MGLDILLLKFVKSVCGRMSILGDIRGVAAMEFALIVGPMVLLFIAGAEMARSVITSRNVEALTFALVDLTSLESVCPYSIAGNTSNCMKSYIAPFTIATTDLDNILAASSAIMGTAPLTDSSGTTNYLQMTLTAVDIVNNASNLCCDFKVRWSYQSYKKNGTVLRGGTNCASDTLTQVNGTTTDPAPTNIPSFLLPVPPAVGASGALTNNEAILIADVSYNYQPILPQVLVGFAPHMTSTRYMFPRQNGGQVVLAGGSALGPALVTGANNNNGQICY